MADALLRPDDAVEQLGDLTISARIQHHWRAGLTSAEIVKKVGLPEADVERIRIGERDRGAGGPRTIVRRRMPLLRFPDIQVIRRSING